LYRRPIGPRNGAVRRREDQGESDQGSTLEHGARLFEQRGERKRPGTVEGRIDMPSVPEHAARMSMVQIRNVPDDIHEKLKVRAAKLKMSMSDYVLMELQRALETPTLEDFLERLASGPKSPPLSSPAAEAVRDEREARTRQLVERRR
jgi:plasmid stability protein